MSSRICGQFITNTSNYNSLRKSVGRCNTNISSFRLLYNSCSIQIALDSKRNSSIFAKQHSSQCFTSTTSLQQIKNLINNIQKQPISIISNIRARKQYFGHKQSFARKHGRILFRGHPTNIACSDICSIPSKCEERQQKRRGRRSLPQVEPHWYRGSTMDCHTVALCFLESFEWS